MVKRTGSKNKKSYRNLINNTYGLLTVISFDFSFIGRSRWNCKCICGTEKSILEKHLISGATVSCGKGHFKGKKSHSWKGYEEISSKYWNQILKNAIMRGLELKISIEDIWELFLNQNRKCALTGMTLCMQETASLDRIDSKKGYIKNNIQWVHKDINYIKMDLDEKRFIELCKMVATHDKIPNAL